MRFVHYLTVLFFFNVSFFQAQQVTVDNSVPLEPLIQNNLVTGCVEISNISLRYRGPDETGKDQGVDFNVQLVAYSQ